MREAGYYAIIPSFVRYDDRLQPNAKLLYGEITALSNKEGYCYATNTYFANLYGVAVTTISEWIKKLEQYGYISSRIDKTAGNQRKLYVTERVVQDTPYSYTGKPEDPLRENPKTSSGKPEDINNTMSNTVNSSTGGSTNVEPPLLFNEQEVGSKSRKTLFRNSLVSDKSVYMQQFAGKPEFAGVDLMYYYEAVKNWSDKSDKMRTARGWVATAIDFMRSDNDKGRLKKTLEAQAEANSNIKQEMLNYLNI